jgi:hypothetical protein
MELSGRVPALRVGVFSTALAGMIAVMDLIRFGGHLPKGGYDVQTDGRQPQAAAHAPTVRF